MDLSTYYDAFWYAGAALVAYNIADIGVCKGCIRGDGKVKKFLVGIAMAFFLRSVWLVGQRMRVDWADEAYYWRNVFFAVIALLAFNACVGCLTRKKERARVPVPPPALAREPGRRGRGGRRG